MKLLEILNEIEVRNIRSYTIVVPIIDKGTGKVVGNKKVLVAPEDLKQKMNWYDAIKACKELGDGKWRLPTKEELEAMYEQLHEQGKGNFKSTFVPLSLPGQSNYWSSSHYHHGRAWMMNFYNGHTYYGPNSYSATLVRPVRNL